VSLVTMVFTDLVSSTAMKRALPGTDVTEQNRLYLETILGPHRDRVRRLLDDCGGRVVKTEGDAFFLVFDDPACAARWAVAVQKDHRDDPIVTPFGPLRVKIGMHTGAPLPDPHYPGDLVGHEVDYAARVAALAGGGQITLSEATAALVRAALLDDAAHPHGNRDLKGIGRVPIFELLYGDGPRPLKDPPPAPANLPPRPIEVAGRDALLDDLTGRLRRGGVVTLKGEGGMGKTTLALEAAHRAIDSAWLAGGAAWINCELGPTLDAAIRQAARVFFGEHDEPDDGAVARARVDEHLARGVALIVLDNFETVAGDPTLLQWLGAIRPPARVLVTSREQPDGLPGVVLRVGELGDDDAVDLLRRRAVDRGVDPPSDELLRKLAATVGCLPLAIDLIAGHAAKLGWERLGSQLAGRLDAAGKTPDLTRPERHRSLGQCVAASYDLLGEPGRDLLLRLAVLPDGAGPDTITGVIGRDDWDDEAGGLVAASLWRLGPCPSGPDRCRYVVHPVVRQFALKKLEADRPARALAAAEALAALAVAKGATANANRSGPGEVLAALDWFEDEWRNLLAASIILAEAGAVDPSFRLAIAIRPFWNSRGALADAEALVGRALNLAHAAGDPVAEAALEVDLGLVHRHVGRHADSVDAFRRALAIYRRIGDRKGEGLALMRLGRTEQYQTRYAESLAHLEEALGLFRDDGDPFGEAGTLAYLSTAHRFIRRFDEAEAEVRASLAISRDHGFHEGERRALLFLGQIFKDQGRWAEAEPWYVASLDLATRIGSRFGEAPAVQNLAVVLDHLGRFAESEILHLRGIGLARDLRHPGMEGCGLRQLAHHWLLLGDRPAALRLARDSAAALALTEDTWSKDQTARLIADLEQSEGHGQDL